MVKLYGKGSITELVKGKKYYVELSGGKDPITGEYLRHRETFLGTKRAAELRIEEIRKELELTRDLREIGLTESKLMECGLSVPIAIAEGLNAVKVRERIEQYEEERRKAVSFADLTQRYLKIRKDSGKLRPKTIAQDCSLSKHLLRGFEGLSVVDITPAKVEELYSSMRAAGIGDTTVKQSHKLLKRILDYAIRDGIIDVNPVSRVEAPRKPKPQRHALNTQDANRLSALCTSETPTANRTATYLGLALGARIGEVLGLEWRHIELRGDRPFIHVCQQFTAQGNIAPLKTDKDDNPVGRIIPIDGSTVAVLKAWRAAQRGILNELGIEQGLNTPVITNQVGTYTSHSRFERWWRSWCVKNGLGKLFTDDGREVIELTIGDDAALYDGCFIQWRDADGWPCDETGRKFSRSYKRPEIKLHYQGLHYHELRHTHFTMRLAAGMDLPTAQALGGWSTPDVLLTTYAHATPENVWASAGFMDKLTAKQAEERRV